jgi:ferric-dicitrate binding protein FerR (iron transport regulator)
MTDHNNQQPSGGTEQDFDALLDAAARADEKYGATVSDSETTAAFQQVSQQAGLSSQSQTSIWKYAAAVVLIGAISIGYLMIPNQISVPRGETQTITLSDQTTITLNSGSTLSYPRWFNIWGRTVSLDGEAFFEVTQTGDPFQVKAGRGLVTVMGTKFNVQSWSDDASATSVFLKEGRVSFSPADDKSKDVILEPGQISQLNSQDAAPSAPKVADPSKATAWMQQGLSFEDQPLSSIFDTLSRRFDINIRVEPQSLLQETLTLYISEVKNAEQTLSDICRVKGLSYQKSGDDTFVISKSF